MKQPSPALLDLRDPEELTETLQPLAPGVRIETSDAAGFRARIRAWLLPASQLFTYSTRHGSAGFGEERGYVAATLALHSSFEARIGAAHEDVPPGRICVLEPGVEGVITPPDGAHILGLGIDAATLEAHRRAASGSWDEALPPLPTFLATETEAGRRLQRTLEQTRAELVAGAGGLADPRIAGERIDRVAALLAEASLEPSPLPARSPSGACFRCAEERLGADLARPLSLADLAREVGTSTRSLSRAFLARHGMGPIAFRRRRRFESARRDLFLAEPEERSVTEVALRYGFGHLGRFALDYRKLFGESPSDTLRH